MHREIFIVFQVDDWHIQSQLRAPPPSVCGWCLPCLARMPSGLSRRAGSCRTVAMCAIVTECSADPCRLNDAHLTQMSNSRMVKDVKCSTSCWSALFLWFFANPPYRLFETILQCPKEVTLMNHSTSQLCLQAYTCVTVYVSMHCQWITTETILSMCFQNYVHRSCLQFYKLLCWQIQDLFLNVGLDGTTHVLHAL